jgi:DNA repair protein RecO (recombination protein O)
LRVEGNSSRTAALSLNTQHSTLNPPLDTTPAILLRKTKLTESSLIVTWLTELHGKLKTVAKGARQAKSRFAGRLDLFFECEIQFSRSRKSELHALREAELREAYDGLRLDYPRVALASYFVELIELVTEPEHAVPELFDLLRRALRYLNEHPADRRSLEHFEKELARLLGIANPNVSAAIAIGRVYHRLPKGRPELIRLLEADNPKSS